MVSLLLRVAALFLASSANALRAQGLPTDTGSHLPVALWWIGSAILALGLIYGIWRNRARSRAQRQITERDTEKVYADTERDRRRSGNP